MPPRKRQEPAVSNQYSVADQPIITTVRKA